MQPQKQQQNRGKNEILLWVTNATAQRKIHTNVIRNTCTRIEKKLSSLVLSLWSKWAMVTVNYAEKQRYFNPFVAYCARTFFCAYLSAHNDVIMGRARKWIWLSDMQLTSSGAIPIAYRLLLFCACASLALFLYIIFCIEYIAVGNSSITMTARFSGVLVYVVVVRLYNRLSVCVFA